MDNKPNNKLKLYAPRQAAKKLGISVRMLQYYRSTGRIEGTDMGNTYAYTEEQIAAARIDEKQQPGPKTKQSAPKAKDEEEIAVAV